MSEPQYDCRDMELIGLHDENRRLRELNALMLHALKLVELIYESHQTKDLPPGCVRYDQPWVEIVKAAIAQAAGTSPEQTPKQPEQIVP